MADAADVLAELARSAESEATRLGAARAALEMAIRLRESIEFAERLDRLEHLAGQAGAE